MLAEQQMAATMIAAGSDAKKMDIKSFDERQIEFDDALAAVPVAASRTDRLWRELGLAA